MDSKCDLLRHAVATVAYRASRALDGAPDSFAEFSGAVRTPAQILAHMGDLFDWALSIAQGRQTWHNSAPLPWAAEKQRFFAALQAFDGALAAPTPPAGEIERLMQGPVADALSHVGQLAMLRRLAGCKMPGESYYAAEVVVGRTGPEQAAPVRPA